MLLRSGFGNKRNRISTPAVSSPSIINLCMNPSFESDFQNWVSEMEDTSLGWTSGEGTGITIDSTRHSSGSKSIKLMADRVLCYASRLSNEMILNQTIAKKVAFEADFYFDNMGDYRTFETKLEIYYKGGGWLTTIPDNKSWQSGTLTPPSNSPNGVWMHYNAVLDMGVEPISSLKLHFILTNGWTSQKIFVNIDNIKVYEID
ncbi:MAG: hypothetical protein K0Q47_13 [Sedimentibacter sp.]|jgi:hypothetical protein|nr:hypothetical protein [Sedimentibacter sp.]